MGRARVTGPARIGIASTTPFFSGEIPSSGWAAAAVRLLEDGGRRRPLELGPFCYLFRPTGPAKLPKTRPIGQHNRQQPADARAGEPQLQAPPTTTAQPYPSAGGGGSICLPTGRGGGSWRGRRRRRTGLRRPLPGLGPRRPGRWRQPRSRSCSGGGGGGGGSGRSWPRARECVQEDHCQ